MDFAKAKIWSPFPLNTNMIFSGFPRYFDLINNKVFEIEETQQTYSSAVREQPALVTAHDGKQNLCTFYSL